MKLKGKTVSLVLGSGGARGFAHIGVIEELERRGCKIAAISGSSMGALVGGAYASGNMRPFKRWVCQLTQIGVLRLVDITFNSQGFIRGQKVFQHIESWIGPYNIEELPIPFTAVATDLETGQEVWINQGSLLQSIQASCAIPTILTPVEIKGRQLVDGGVLNPTPIEPILDAYNDLIIVVNVNARPKKKKQAQIVKNHEGQNASWYRSTWIDGISGLKSARERLNYLGIMSKTIDLMQEKLTEFSLYHHQPDIIINIAYDTCNFYEFYEAKKMVKIGRKKCKKALNKYIKQQKKQAAAPPVDLARLRARIWYNLPRRMKKWYMRYG